jgi:hypothetical protein
MGLRAAEDDGDALVARAFSRHVFDRVSSSPTAC